jgi:hypothetical protein
MHGGRAPERGLSTGAGVPLVVAGELAGGGPSLLILAVFAYLKAAPLGLVRLAAWFLRGLEAAERKLVDAGAIAGLAPSPRLAALVARAAAHRRPIYLASRRCSPLLEALAAKLQGVSGVIVVPGGVGSRRGADRAHASFPEGYDAVVSERGVIRNAWHAPAGALVARGHAPDLPAIDEDDTPRISLARELVISLRLHQSVKNTLVLVPVILSGRFTQLIEITIRCWLSWRSPASRAAPTSSMTSGTWRTTGPTGRSTRGRLRADACPWP